MPYRTPVFQQPRPPPPRAGEGHGAEVRVVQRPLEQELLRALLWGLPLGVILVPGWVRLLDLVR